MLNIAHHHLVTRKIHKRLTFWEKVFDRFVLVGAFLGPMATLPQVFQIYQSKDVSGVSALSWGGYFLGSFVWLGYGLLHKEKPIIVSNLLFSIFTFLIVLGTIIYGK